MNSHSVRQAALRRRETCWKSHEGMAMKVSDVMTTDVITVRADTTFLTGFPALHDVRLERIVLRADILRLPAKSE